MEIHKNYERLGNFMDQKPNAYQLFVAQRAVEREGKNSEKSAKKDDVDSCDDVYRPHRCGRDDDNDPEYY